MFPGELFTLFMISVPFIMKQILLQLILTFQHFCLFIRQDLIRLLHLFIVNTIIISILGRMAFPVFKTQPAELVVAELAGHVHAATVFFDVAAAFGAWLCVGLDPGQVFRIADFFFEPEHDEVAAGWQVVFLAASKAKRVAALTLNNVSYRVIAALNHQIAILGRTPLDILVIICELPTVPLQILHKVINNFAFNNLLLPLQQSNPDRVRYDDITPHLLALHEHAFYTFRDHFLFQILSPAYFAKLVLAGQAQFGAFYRVELTLADLTRVFIVLSERSYRSLSIILDTYNLLQLFLFLEPFALKFRLVPFKISQNRNHLIIIVETKQILSDRQLLRNLPCQNLIHSINHDLALVITHAFRELERVNRSLSTIDHLCIAPIVILF